MKNKPHNHWWKGLLLGLTAAALMTISQAGAAEERQPATIAGREIAERLTRLEDRVARLEERVTRLEEKVAALGQRIDDLRQVVLAGFGITFAGMFALVGFVIWDRRTALAPAVRRVEDLQDRQQRIEKALRELSRDNPKLAESLRNLELL